MVLILLTAFRKKNYFIISLTTFSPTQESQTFQCKALGAYEGIINSALEIQTLIWDHKRNE